MRSVRNPAALGAIALLASCVAPERRPAPPPTPQAPATIAAPVSDDWRDLPRTPGDWRWSATETTSGARFTGPDGIMLFALRCDDEIRQVRLLRAGGIADGGTATMAFTTSAGAFAYPAAADLAIPGSLAASVAASDPGLDRIAFSRGRFAVAVTGQARLVLPAAPEIGRVIEDCRS